MTDKLPVRIKCTECEGENVRRDADAEWDVEAQEWVLVAVYDSATCDDCGRETTLTETPLVKCTQ